MTHARGHDPDDIACIEEVKLAADYLEGTLDPGHAERLERHLETCEGCTEYIEQMRAVARSLGGLSGDSLSAGARARLLDEFKKL